MVVISEDPNPRKMMLTEVKLCKSAISYIGNVSWAAQSPDQAQTAGHKPSTHGPVVTPAAAHIFWIIHRQNSVWK